MIKYVIFPITYTLNVFKFKKGVMSQLINEWNGSKEALIFYIRFGLKTNFDRNIQAYIHVLQCRYKI